MSAARHRLFLLPVARMGLAPLPHMLGVFRASEVAATEGCAPPSALAGLFTGVLASGLAAVMLPVLVAAIGEEKLAATTALTSVRLQDHLAPKPKRSGEKLNENRRSEEEPKGRRKKSFLSEEPEENPREEKAISNRRF